MPTTPNLEINHWAAGTNQPEVVVSDGFDDFDNAITQKLDLTVSGTVTLTDDQAFRNFAYVLTGTGGTMEVPDGNQKLYVVLNNTSGPVTVKTVGGTGAVVTAGNWIWAYADGVNVQDASPSGGGGSTTFKGLIDTPGSGTEKQIVEWDSGNNLVNADFPWDIIFSWSGAPTASQELIRHIAARKFEINLTDSVSYGSARQAPSSNMVFSVENNDVQVGTVTITTGGAFQFTGAQQTFAVNQRLTVVAPGTIPTTSAEDFGMTFFGKLVP